MARDHEVRAVTAYLRAMPCIGYTRDEVERDIDRGFYDWLLCPGEDAEADVRGFRMVTYRGAGRPGADGIEEVDAESIGLKVSARYRPWYGVFVWWWDRAFGTRRNYFDCGTGAPWTFVAHRGAAQDDPRIPTLTVTGIGLGDDRDP